MITLGKLDDFSGKFKSQVKLLKASISMQRITDYDLISPNEFVIRFAICLEFLYLVILGIFCLVFPKLKAFILLLVWIFAVVKSNSIEFLYFFFLLLIHFCHGS